MAEAAARTSRSRLPRSAAPPMGRRPAVRLRCMALWPEATISSGCLGWSPQWQSPPCTVESSREPGTSPPADPTAMAGMAVVAGATATGADPNWLHARCGGRGPTPRILPGRWGASSRRDRSGNPRVTSRACAPRGGRPGHAGKSSPSGVPILSGRHGCLRRAAGRRDPRSGTDFAHRAHRCAGLFTRHPARAVAARPAHRFLKL